MFSKKGRRKKSIRVKIGKININKLLQGKIPRIEIELIDEIEIDKTPVLQDNRQKFAKVIDATPLIEEHKKKKIHEKI